MNAVFKACVGAADDVVIFDGLLIFEVVFVISGASDDKEVMKSEQARHCVLESTVDAIFPTFSVTIGILAISNLPGQPEEVDDRREDEAD